jgi:hypothetical protein
VSTSLENGRSSVHIRISFPFSSSDSELTSFSDAFPVIGSQEVADFSPVLNVPALASFLVVTAIFLFLQFRVASIGRAAEERTEALGALRSLKAKELTGEASPAEVNLALAKYRETYDRVEELRTVVPGARIVPPPSQSLSRERMDDNTAAARQFLGIESEAPVGKDDDTERSLPLPLALLLAVVAASQIGVLVLLSVDPMAHTGIF